MTKIDLYWLDNKEWLEEKEGRLVPKEDAPKEVKDSYKRCKEQIKEFQRKK